MSVGSTGEQPNIQAAEAQLTPQQLQEAKGLESKYESLSPADKKNVLVKALTTFADANLAPAEMKYVEMKYGVTPAQLNQYLGNNPSVGNSVSNINQGLQNMAMSYASHLQNS